MVCTDRQFSSLVRASRSRLNPLSSNVSTRRRNSAAARSYSSINAPIAPLRYTRFMSADGISKPRSHRRRGLCGRQHRNNLKVREVAPVRHPLIKEAAILALHDLETASQVVGHPAADVFKSVRHHPASISEAPIHRGWIPAVKGFNDHVHHVGQA